MNTVHDGLKSGISAVPWAKAFKLFLSHILIALFFFNVWTVGYPGRIVYLAKALVEHRTFSMASYVGDSVFAQYAEFDLVEYEGRLLNPHSPGTSFLATLGVWVYESITDSRFANNPLLDYYLASVFAGLTSTILLYAVSVACLYLLFQSTLNNGVRALFFTLVYSLCTPILFYGSRNSEDSLVTSLLVISFSSLVFVRKSQPKHRLWLIGLSGLSLGYAGLSKMPGFIALPFIVFLFIHGRRCYDFNRRERVINSLVFLTALAISFIILAIVNQHNYGTPFADPIALYVRQASGNLHFDDVSNLSTRASALARCLLNLKCYTYYTIEPSYGVLTNSPVLFLAPLGFVMSIFARRQRKQLSCVELGFTKLEQITVAFIILAYIGLEMSLTHKHATEFGSKYALPSAAFLVILTALYSRYFSRSITVFLAAISGLFAISSTFLGTGNSYYSLKVLYPVIYFAVKGPFSPLLRSFMEVINSDIQGISGIGATLLLFFCLALIWGGEINETVLRAINRQPALQG